jgi:hypothetical protein
MTTLSPTTSSFTSTRNNDFDETSDISFAKATMTATTCDDVQVVVVDDDDLESGGRNNNRRRQYKPHQESLVIQTPIMGVCIRGKYQLRAAVQTVALSALVIGCAVLHIYNSSFPNGINDNYDEQDQQNHRFLQDTSIAPSASPILCSSLETTSHWYMTVIYIIGILYMFLALAIVCDEFFVPALEELSGPRRLNLSMDVAGKYNCSFQNRVFLVGFSFVLLLNE